MPITSVVRTKTASKDAVNKRVKVTRKVTFRGYVAPNPLKPIVRSPLKSVVWNATQQHLQSTEYADWVVSHDWLNTIANFPVTPDIPTRYGDGTTPSEVGKAFVESVDLKFTFESTTAGLSRSGYFVRILVWIGNSARARAPQQILQTDKSGVPLLLNPVARQCEQEDCRVLVDELIQIQAMSQWSPTFSAVREVKCYKLNPRCFVRSDEATILDYQQIYADVICDQNGCIECRASADVRYTQGVE